MRTRSKEIKRESKVAQSCPTLCDPVDCSLPGFSVYGILQARILKWVAISFSRGSSQARNQTLVSCIAGRFFTNWATREARPGVKSSLLSVSKVRVVSTSLNGWGKKRKVAYFVAHDNFIQFNRQCPLNKLLQEHWPTTHSQSSIIYRYFLHYKWQNRT